MPLAMVAEFEVPSKALEAFLDAGRREMRAVRENEPGCLRFDIVLYDEGKGHGAFLEIYEDSVTARKHMECPHFKTFFDEVGKLDVQWTLHPGKTIE